MFSPLVNSASIETSGTPMEPGVGLKVDKALFSDPTSILSRVFFCDACCIIVEEFTVLFPHLDGGIPGPRGLAVVHRVLL